MNIHVAFDMDGVLADFASAYLAVEKRLFGPGVARPREKPEEEQEADPVATSIHQVKAQQRRREAIWDSIQSTPDFWVTLKPIRKHAVARLHALMLQHGWEVLFITQRPATLGDTVQLQTQRWLREQGFDIPSVLVVHGSRSGAARFLALDYYVDDSATNCVDFTSDTSARPILVVGDEDPAALVSARRLGIATARDIEVALDVLDQASTAHTQPRVLQHLAQLVGWK